MKNSFEIRGEETAIFLSRKDGALLETIISTLDLKRAQEFPNSWYAHYDKSINGFYVRGNAPRKSGRKTIYLHRWLLNAEGKIKVDHVDHDTLNNKRSNLRLVTNSQNLQNRKGAQIDNYSSGIRGVTWHKSSKKWYGKVKLKGKNHYAGSFDCIKEAEKAVVELRKKLLPYSNN